MVSIAVGTEKKEDQVVSIKRQLMEIGKNSGRSLMKIEKATSHERIPVKHLRGLKWSNLLDFDKPRKCTCQ